MQIELFPITIIIVVLTVIITMKAFGDPDMKYRFMLYPYKMKRENDFKRLFTHLFIHGDSMHLFFNMYVLFSFGGLMEQILKMEHGNILGSVHFVLLYFLGGLAASIWPFTRNHDNPHYMSLGASGAVSALVFAFILWMPNGELGLLFIPGLKIPAWIFGALYLGFEYYMSRKNANTGIAHDAHFGGAIFGIAYVLMINPERGKIFINYILN
jgi:membrane associated rhomboid family serine protease